MSHLEHPPIDHTPEPDKGLSRREVLKGIGAALVGASVGGYMTNEVVKTIQELDAKAAADTDHGEPHNEGHGNEHEPDLDFDKLNWQTALPVTSAFVAYIADGAFMGGSFGARSAAVLNSLEALRLGTLYSKGGEQGVHVAQHEFAENALAGGIALGLVAISDFTTTAVELDHETLFAKAQEIIETNNETVARPELHAPVEAWEAYIERMNKRLVQDVTEMQAITSILAPLLTTYTSSAIADTLKQNVIPTLFEQSYAKSVVERHKTGQSIEAGAIQAEAINRTNECMNGPWGMNNLETTLAANVQGGVLIGDPPQLFGFANHKGNWGRLAKGEAFGMLNDAAMTYGLTATWLGSVDALPSQAELAAQFKTAFARAAEVRKGVSLTAPDKKQFDAMQVALRELGLKDVEAMVEAKKLLHLSFDDYVARKAHWMNVFVDKKTGINLADVVKSIRLQANVTAAAGLDKMDTFREMLFKPEGPSMSDAGTIGVDNSLTTLYVDAMGEVDAYQLPEDRLELDAEVDVAEVERMTKQVRGVMKQGEALTPKSGALNVEGIINALGLSTAEGGVTSEKIVARLEELADEDPAKLQLIIDANMAPGTAELQPSAQHVEHHGPISHAGLEVGAALFSQMPAVGPTAVLAEQSLISAFNLQGGEKRSSKAKVMAAVSAAFFSEAILSSLADNVAAYMYAEKLLTNIIGKVYGADVLQKFPKVGDVIYATSIKLAEQAGALTKLGNGPNFSQRKYELTPGVDGKDFEVTSEEIPFELYTNRYAVAANGLLMAGSIGWLNSALDEIERAVAKPVSTPAPSLTPHATPAH